MRIDCSHSSSRSRPIALGILKNDKTLSDLIGEEELEGGREGGRERGGEGGRER